MLEAFITSRARRVLLTWFITHPGEKFHMQQLIRDLDLSSSQIQNELARLESVGFLKSRREANARFFEINPYVFSRGDWMERITSKQPFAMNIMRSPTLTLIGDASVVRGAPTTPKEMTR